VSVKIKGLKQHCQRKTDQKVAIFCISGMLMLKNMTRSDNQQHYKVGKNEWKFPIS